MSDTASLTLPLLAAEQAQKHVTVNEALGLLDAIVQLSVKDRDLAVAPGSPADGDRYIVGAGATGAWAGKAAQIAVRRNGDWTFRPPRVGWRSWVDDENVFLIFNGIAWVDWGAALGALQNLSLLGIGTTADVTNRFAAKLNKALWTAKTAAEGGDGDLRYTMNKETAADTLSLLLQRGFSGRAEIGLVGDDDLTFKVSADGATWRDALKIDRTSGLITTLGQIKFPAAENASADANTLDDYEEGTFSPTLSAVTTAPTGVTYSTQTGRYTKVGRLVLAEGRMTLTNKGAGGVGQAQLANLPFSAGAVGFTTQLRLNAGLTLPASTTLAAVVIGTFLRFQSNGNTGAADVDWSSLTNSFDVVFSATYSV